MLYQGGAGLQSFILAVAHCNAGKVSGPVAEVELFGKALASSTESRRQGCIAGAILEDLSLQARKTRKSRGAALDGVFGVDGWPTGGRMT